MKKKKSSGLKTKTAQNAMKDEKKENSQDDSNPESFSSLRMSKREKSSLFEIKVISEEEIIESSTILYRADQDLPIAANIEESKSQGVNEIETQRIAENNNPSKFQRIGIILRFCFLVPAREGFEKERFSYLPFYENVNIKTFIGKSFAFLSCLRFTIFAGFFVFAEESPLIAIYFLTSFSLFLMILAFLKPFTQIYSNLQAFITEFLSFLLSSLLVALSEFP